MPNVCFAHGLERFCGNSVPWDRESVTTAQPQEGTEQLCDCRWAGWRVYSEAFIQKLEWTCSRRWQCTLCHLPVLPWERCGLNNNRLK